MIFKIKKYTDRNSFAEILKMSSSLSQEAKFFIPITQSTKNKLKKDLNIYGSRLDRGYEIFPIMMVDNYDAYYTVYVDEDKRKIILTSDLIIKQDQPVKTFYNGILDKDFEEKDIESYHELDSLVRINVTSNYFRERNFTYCIYENENVTYKKYYELFPPEFLIKKLRKVFLKKSEKIHFKEITRDEIDFLTYYSLIIGKKDNRGEELLRCISKVKQEIFELIKDY